MERKKILYENVLLPSNSDTLEELRELSSKRKAIEESTNESSHITEAIAREMSGGLTSRWEQDIQKLELYLPLLVNLIRQVNAKGTWSSCLKIRWSSVLTSSSIFHISGTKFYQVNNLYFELGMNLFLYAAMLRERALEVLASDLVLSAMLFRKAAGVYKYLAHNVFIHLFPAEERQPEATIVVSYVMSLMCLADAQAVTARKAEENNRTCSLLSKLHCGITEFLVEAADLLQSTSRGCTDTSSRLLDYVLSCKALHNLRCYKHLADGFKNDGKIGIAIGLLHQALTTAKKTTLKEESWRSVHKQTMEELIAVVRKYEHENEFVWNDKVPSNDELPLPQGIKIVEPIPYEPQKREKKLAFKSVQ